MGLLDFGSPRVRLRADRASRPARGPSLRGQQRWARVAQSGADGRPGHRRERELRQPASRATIVHWHGLTIDSHNDGNGELLAEPGAIFDYRFAVVEPRRHLLVPSASAWPHCGQAQRGLFGALIVSDAEEKSLSHALDVRLGVTDIPLVLHDRRSMHACRLLPSPTDVIHGYVGDEMTVNGTLRPYLDVASRGYRLRVINAANARTFRVAFRAADGALLPFALLGTDGGLLAHPLPLREVFVAAAERVDLWIDFRERVLGDSIVMESLAFDPMHMDMATPHPRPQHRWRAPVTAWIIITAQWRWATAAPPSPTARDCRCCNSASAAKSPHRQRHRPRCRRSQRLFREPPSGRCAFRSPRGAGGSTTACSRWTASRRLSSPAIPPKHGCSATTTPACRTRCTCTASRCACSARETSPDFITALAVDAQGRLPTDLGVKDTVLVWPGESVRVAIDFHCDFPGDQIYLVHCHNLEHEDGGMMLRVKVT